MDTSSDGRGAVTARSGQRGVTVRKVRRLGNRAGAAAAGGPAEPATPKSPEESRDDELAVEEPLEIKVAGETLAITMRTPGGPGEDERLALGFLFAEGVLAGRDDVVRISHCGKPGTPEAGNVLDVIPSGGSRVDLDRISATRRGTLTTSACGVCGRRSIDDVIARVPKVPHRQLSASLLFAAVEALRGHQPRFRLTGGLHAAAVFDQSGVLAAAEDVGRHNAVDKVVGALLLAGRVPPGPEDAPRVLAVSGRASFELVQKAAAAGCAAVASVSAPSSLAADLAEASGLVLAGFVRGGALNLYAGAAFVVE
jgi:FdhD protein